MVATSAAPAIITGIIFFFLLKLYNKMAVITAIEIRMATFANNKLNTNAIPINKPITNTIPESPSL